MTPSPASCGRPGAQPDRPRVPHPDRSESR